MNFTSLLPGRASRREFWVVSALLFAIKLPIVILSGSAVIADAVGFAPWLWVAWRRCHDINASGWWSLLPFSLGFIEGFVRGFTKSWDRSHALMSTPANPLQQFDWSLALAHPDYFATGFMQGFANSQWALLQENPLGTGVGWIVVLVLALLPGTPGDNRFGERRTAPSQPT